VVNYAPEARLYAAPDNVKMLSLMNVKYIYGFGELSGPEYKDLGEIHYDEFRYGLHIYENTKCLPKAFVAGGFSVCSSSEEMQNIIASADFDPAGKLLLREVPEEEFIQSAKDIQTVPNHRIISEEYKANSSRIVLETENDGLLFISRRYLPQWVSYVNGEETRIYQADILFQAVPVKKGKNVVYLVFRLKSFYIGLAVSAIALLLVVFNLLKRSNRAP
jgi:hypothetical protein